MSEIIDFHDRQRIALVGDQLQRDLENTLGAIEHHGGRMPEAHFTLALFSAVAGFCADRADPAAADRETTADLLIDVFGGELLKAFRRRLASADKVPGR